MNMETKIIFEPRKDENCLLVSVVCQQNGRTIQIPTFILNRHIQGIISKAGLENIRRIL
tara:strand:- start:15694 stop:15870 length:177 start_codon:yes stop_codon:yes gene_type:complete